MQSMQNLIEAIQQEPGLSGKQREDLTESLVMRWHADERRIPR